MLEGAVSHRDSRGNAGVLQAGDVQFMSAGRGVLHSELPHGTAPCHMLQCWLNLPRERKLSEPRYLDLPAARATRLAPAPGIDVRLYSGRLGDARCTAYEQERVHHVPNTVLRATLAPRATLVDRLPAFWNYFVYVLDGAVVVNDTTPLAAPQVGLFPPVAGVEPPGGVAWKVPLDDAFAPALTDRLTLHNAHASSPVDLVLFAGAPLREPVVHRGPFVMNTADEIARAYRDIRDGTFV